jgi:protein OS-9
VCDKTGRRREIEVQFHCSPTSTDTILFVKEIRTCAYVLVVHTPRLCGVPGFRARRDAQAHEQIRCREVVHALQSHAGVGLPSADSPIRLPQRPKPSLPAPAKEQPPPVPGEKKAVPGAGMTDEMVKKALSLLLGADGENVGIERVTVQPGAEEGEYIVELLDEDYAGGDGYGYPQGADNAATREALLKILQGAGVDVAGYAAPPDGKGKEKNKKQQQQQQQQQKFSHDEMEEEDEEDMPIFRDEL